MNLYFDGFDWDDGNRRKCLKHGVSIPEIESVLRGKPLILPDIGHSRDEIRYKAVGKNDDGIRVFRFHVTGSPAPASDQGHQRAVHA